MDLWASALLFLAGLVLIVKGGDWFLSGAVYLAEVTGVPRFVIGATVVSLATTLPELTVSVMGVLRRQTDLAVGNAVGSVTANLGLILGLTALCMPARVDRGQFGGRALLMTGAVVMLLPLCGGGTFSLWPGGLLLVLLILGLERSLAEARRERSRLPASRRRPWRRRQAAEKLAFFAVGLAAILAGSRLLIDQGGALALALGVPSAVIGVTLVAVGTSLPELVTALTAIVRRETALSVGNILGANLIDLTLILPVSALAGGGRLSIGAQTRTLDLPVCLALCLGAVLPPLAAGRFSRWQGALLLAAYGGYAAALLH